MPPKGLIHALMLDGSGGAKELVWQESSPESSQIANPQISTPSNTTQENLWLHFNYDEPESQQWIENNSGLNRIAVESLLSEETRPHVLTRGDNLLIVLRGVNLNPGEDPEDMVSLRVWTDGKRLISTRKRKLLSTEDVLDSLRDQVGPENIASLLVDWIDRIVRRMSSTVDNLEDDVLAIEDKLFSDENSGIRTALLRARKQSIGIRRYLSPQREALNRLIGEPLSWLDDFNRLRLRSIADRQIRHIEDIDAVTERARMAQEELSNKISEQMNKRSYVLTIVAAIFLPLGFFTGLMGINVGGMPGVDYSQAFWIVLGICSGILGLLLMVFYWRKWL